MASGKDYRLLLKASIDESSVKSLQTQIDSLSKKYGLKVKIALDDKSLNDLNSKLDKVINSGKSKVKIIDEKVELQSLDDIQMRIKELQDLGKNVQTTNVTNNLGEVTGQIVKYRDEQDKTVTETYKLQQATQQNNAGFTQTTKTVEGSTKSLSTWTDGLSNAISRTLQYATSIGLVYGALNQIRQGIQFIKDLNKEMTNIQLVTGQNDSEIGDLAIQYNNLAKEMGSTTVEVAKGSLEFIRQGKTAEETGILIKNSTMMSKLGNMDAAQSTEILTSIMNGYKLKAEETGAVVDKLVAIDNIAATSVNELGTAMQYSSASAQQVGIDFNHLAAYIGTVSSVTRISAETIGQAMKTITSRMTAIKDMKAFDEEGEPINKVEEALHGVGIELRDSQHHFRNMQDVLDETAKKWHTFSTEQQIFIAQKLGGVRQQNIVLALLSNETEIQKQLTAETNASGLATQRFGIYLKGIEATQNKFITSWEQFVMSGTTKDMITDFYNAGSAILDLVSAMGGIPTILKITIPLLILFNLTWLNTQRLAISSSINTAVIAIQDLATALFVVNPAMAETAALEGGVASGLDAIVISEAAATLGLTLLAGALAYATIKTIEFKKAQDDILNNLKDTEKSIKDNSSSYDDYVKKTTEAAKAAGYFYDANGKLFHTGYHNAKVYVENMDMLTESQWKAKDSVDALDKSERDNVDTVSTLTDTYDGATSGFVDFQSTLKEIGDTFSSTNDLINNYVENGMSLEDVSKIPPEYLDALSVEGDKLTLNIDLIKQKELATVSASLETIKAAEANGQAASQEVSVIQLAYNQLLSESQKTYGEFHQTAWQYDALLWQISNDAIKSGYNTFKDTQGNALNSAQQIHDYMASSSGAFNNFVNQVANATGRSVAQVTDIINQMINSTISNLNTLSQQADAARYTGLAAMYGVTPTHGNAPSLFPMVSSPSFSGYNGGGGGSSSSSIDKQTQADEKLKKIEDDITNARKASEDSLNKQLKSYKDIVDERKKLLDSLKDERSYQEDLEDKQKSILDIQNQMLALQFDNSDEAKARKLQLQDDLNKAQQSLDDSQYNHSIDQQKDALDTDYSNFEDAINKAIDSIESIDASSVSGFAAQLASVLASIVMPPTHHTGLDAGFVGGVKGNEQFIKALKGEVLVNPQQQDNFMKNILPQSMISNQSTNKEVNIDKLMDITVQGNLDSSVVPDIQNIAKNVIKELNKITINRGINRRADLFQT